jgi:hypothetical protein
MPAKGGWHEDHGDHYKKHGFPGRDDIGKSQTDKESNQQGNDRGQLSDADSFLSADIFS